MEEKGRREVEREVGRCGLFINKRGRYCKLPVARGSKYCGEHLTFDPEQGATSQRRRIPCPLDPHHTVYEDQLQAHLKKCNVTKKGRPECYRANINTGMPDYHSSEDEKKPLSAFSQSQVDAVIAKVEKVYNECMGEIEEVVLEHAVLNSDLSDPANGPTAMKHIRQQASILGHMERLGLIQPHTCYIEFGAGRGKLSNCVQRVCVDDESIQYILIDRASCRRKKDVYLRGDPKSEARVRRINIDIEHLDLGRVECLQNEEVRHVVAISKHLCGAATDMTLRCLLETLPQSHDHLSRPMNSDDGTLHHQDNLQSGPPDPKRTCTHNTSRLPSSKLRGLVIALCCHHRCSWSQLAGADWLRGRGFSPIDAHLVSKMTSWAVCGVRSPYHHGSLSDTEHDHTENDVIPESNSDTATIDSAQSSIAMATSSAQSSVAVTTHSTQSSIAMATSPTPPSYCPHPREGVGLKCKRVLDLAKLHYLRERGMEGRLVYFVSRATSLENVLLIATTTAAT